MSDQQPSQSEFPLDSALLEPAKQAVLALLVAGRQPSAWELVKALERRIWDEGALGVADRAWNQLAEDEGIDPGALREYCRESMDSQRSGGGFAWRGCSGKADGVHD